MEFRFRSLQCRLKVHTKVTPRLLSITAITSFPEIDSHKSAFPTIAIIVQTTNHRWTFSRALLFVLSVVTGVDGTKDEFQDPETRSEFDRRIGACHLRGLILVVGRAVYHASDTWVVIKLS